MKLGDLDDLQKTFELWLLAGKDYNEGERNMIKAAINEVKAMPTVDAVPVVRCVNCKHYEKSCYAGFWHCEVWDQEISMKAHDPYKYFCAEGERRSE